MKTWLKTSIRFTAVWATRILLVGIVLPLLYCLEPFRPIRIGRISSQQIGMLAGNCFLMLQRRALNRMADNATYILPVWDPSNVQLLKMFARYIKIIESRWLTRLSSWCWPIGVKTRFFVRLPWSDMDYFEFFHAKVSLDFTQEEEEFGQQQLHKIGIGKDDWFVCIHARDAAYKNAWRPQFKDAYDTRNFRNSSIENYLEAAEYITSLGGYVLRMGHTVETPLPETGNPKIIDYASHFRSDFLDIYLPAKCRFFLGNNSGLFVVSSIFGVPVAVANCFPMGLMPINSFDLYIPKLLRATKTNEIVPFEVAHSQGFFDFDKMSQTGLHESYGYEWVENEPEDILALTKDMLDTLENREPKDQNGVNFSAAFKAQFNNHIPDNRMAGRIAPSFASKYRQLIQTQQ